MLVGRPGSRQRGRLQFRLRFRFRFSMDASFADLITLLELEPIEENIFRGQSRDIGLSLIHISEPTRPY